MIRGFEEETHPLTEQEQELAIKLAAGINLSPNKHKRHNALTLIKGFNQAYGIKLSQVRLRKLIQYIRVNVLIFGLCSDNRGYWVYNTSEELKKTILSLTDRINFQIATRDALQKQLDHLSPETEKISKSTKLF